jgi:2-dehydropantoate 2-reductase
VAFLREAGLELEAVAGAQHLPVKALVPGELEGLYDLVILTAPGRDLGNLLRAISPFVHRNTFYVCLSETLQRDAAADLVGEERVLAAVPDLAVAWMEEGRRAELIGQGIVVGEWDGADTPRLREVTALLGEAGLGEVRASDAIRSELWTRACLTVPMQSLGAVVGAAFDDLITMEGVPDLFLKTAGEVEAVTVAQGLQLLVPAGLEEARQTAWSRVESPLLSDLRRGRRTDNVFMAAFVAGHGRESGLKTPHLTALSLLIREMERQEREPGAASLAELRRRIEEERGMFLT